MNTPRRNKKSLSSRKRHMAWVQKKTVVADGAGGFTETWANDRWIFCGINPIRARDRGIYRGSDVEATHLIEVDGYETIGEDERISFNGRILHVQTIENLQERNIENVIIAREIRLNENSN